MQYWWENQATVKNEKVVVKLYDNGDFKQSIVVPTRYYPLNGVCEVFTYKNTESVTDEKILRIFDSVKYKIGKCYQNSEDLLSLLREENIDAKSYCGWLFVNGYDTPIHHCWIVVNGKHVLDLGDDFTVMLSGQNGEHFKNVKIEEGRSLVVDFHREAIKFPNRVRCAPVGIPTPFLFYVGCECDPEQGREIYQRLMKEYPHHECERNCDSNGLNKTQALMKNKGLM